MARRKRKKQTESGGDGWLTTFSDLMSLLLTFFILLFSMSNVSEAKFSSASQSIQKALMGETGGSSILDGAGIQNLETGQETGHLENEAANNIPQQVTKMYEEAMALIEKEGIEDQISVSSDQDGVYLDIQESILFDSGQAQISAVGQNTLDSLTELLLLSDNDIIVEGFTDNVPIRSVKYPSNWELSAGRAMAVVRYLVEEKNIEPSRMSGRGYGEYNPVVPNDTPENRAKNRRVNIVLVYQPEEATVNEQ